MKVEVRVVYEGVATYLVDVESLELAADEGKRRYEAGEPEDSTGSEWEKIVDVTVAIVQNGALPA